LEFERKVLTEFYNSNSLMVDFFVLPEWQEGEKPYLILKGTENSTVGSYVIYVNVRTEYTCYNLMLYYCPKLSEINPSTNIEVGPLTTFYNTDIYAKKANDHKGGDPDLVIIPISTSCTVLAFTFNDMLNVCGLITIYNSKGIKYINIITNGSA
jgi:hypothetical protein